MPYTVEIFNRFNQLVEASRNAVCRHIQYLLKPADGYPKGSDAKLKELYNVWRADCRAMDAACEEDVHLAARGEMIEMPPDDKEHVLCRQMAAVIIERSIFGEHNAEHYLPALVGQMMRSDCWKHSDSCACHTLNGWTYNNKDLLHTLTMYYIEKTACCTGRNGCSACVGGAPGGGALEYQASMGGGRPSEVTHAENCACTACYKARLANGTADAYMKRCQEESDKMLAKLGIHHTSVKESQMLDDPDLIKNLFKTVQGVEYDSKCPHGLPFYACMACSH